jgi:hypothetical protein
VGKIKFGHFDATNADRSIVATDENVLAAISSKNGEILWRKVFEEEDSRGEIKFLHVSKNSKSVTSYSNEPDPFDVITVNGYNPIFFRGWDINNGHLIWEWAITPTSSNPEESLFFLNDFNIYHVLPVWNSHIEVTEYHASTGQQTKPSSGLISAGWITKDRCVLSSQYFACVVKDQLLVLDLLAEQNNIRTKAIDPPAASSIKVLRGQENIVQVGKQIISLEDLSIVYENRNNDEIYMDATPLKLVQSGKSLKITSDDQEVSEIDDLPETLNNNLQIISSKCKSKRENVNQLACRFLLSTDDGAIVLLQQGKIKWIREEALTKIAAVEFLELSLSDAQGAMEEELNSADGRISII